MNKIVGETRELRSLERCKILMAVFGLLKYHTFRNVMIKPDYFIILFYKYISFKKPAI